MNGTDLQQRITEAKRLAERYDYEVDHAQQVCRLALMLFDGLAPLHRLGAYERWLVQAGALLHDIGWQDGRQGHHRASMKAILRADDQPWSDDERRMIALIARYHRKALPSEDHELYPELCSSEKQLLASLAGMVRLADGLDRSHAAVVRFITLESHHPAIGLHCRTIASPTLEREKAAKKADLLQLAFDRPVDLLFSPADGSAGK